MADVSARLRSRIGRDFPEPGSADEVTRMVAGASDSERIQAGIVLLAGGNLADLRDALELARLDWRDVLMAAELAGDDWPQRLDAELGSSR